MCITHIFTFGISKPQTIHAYSFPQLKTPKPQISAQKKIPLNIFTLIAQNQNYVIRSPTSINQIKQKFICKNLPLQRPILEQLMNSHWWLFLIDCHQYVELVEMPLFCPIFGICANFKRFFSILLHCTVLLRYRADVCEQKYLFLPSNCCCF